MPVARVLWNRRVAAGDGVELAVDVLLPEGAGPFPTLVVRTPYVRGRLLNNPKSWISLVDRGYALVTVDLRGRNDSGGDWRPFVRDSLDGHAVIEWAGSQAWSNGKVGLVGGSYEGCTQWWTIVSRPKHLVCAVPLCWGGSRQRLPFGCGIPMQYWIWWLAMVMGKTYQFAGAPAWETGMAHTPLRTLDEQFGLSRSAWRSYVDGEIDFCSQHATLSVEEYEQIEIPVFIGVGWWDDQETMLAWQSLQRARSAADCRLLIGAWDHAGNLAPRPTLGGLDVSASVIDTMDYIEKFLALHLKGEGAQTPRCRVFVTGEDRWESLDSWPPPRTGMSTFYLASHGDARGLRGGGRLHTTNDSVGAADTFVYDPNDPGRDMSSLAAFAWADPPLDYRYLQRRCDILVYTSEPLPTALHVSGRYQLRVFVSSDRPDTDLFVSLCDVHPDGRAVGLAATLEPPAALRLRYRNGPQSELLYPGRIYEVTVEGSWLHHVFKVGHRVRVAINSGNYPLMARNAGTGGHWADDTRLLPQTNTIYHSTQYPSRILLPMVREALS